MAKVPVRKLRKDEIIWLAEHNCEAHSTNYFSHYGCFLQEHPEGAPLGLQEKIGFFDIETSNFKANFGIVYSYCIGSSEDDSILERVITPGELKSKGMDKNLIAQCIKDLMKFDRVVTYYGTGFDLPFVRTRALFHGLDFPHYTEILHTDVYYMVRGKLRLSRNSQEGAHRLLCGKSEKTHYGTDEWTRAMTGYVPALNYIIEHNRIDVQELKNLYMVMCNFSAKNKRSI
jgi:uncharacterized protein YprB with RNaseH-like and TPR domain